MIRRKKSSSGKSSRKKRGGNLNAFSLNENITIISTVIQFPESSSPTRRRGSDACNPPPEFAPYDYDTLSPYAMKCLKGQHYPFLSNGFVSF